MRHIHYLTGIGLAFCLIAGACASDTGENSEGDSGTVVDTTSDQDTQETSSPDTAGGSDTGDTQTSTDTAAGADTTEAADTSSEDTGESDDDTDMADTGEMGSEDTEESTSDTGPSIYQGSDPVYDKGSLATEKFEISSSSTQSPVDAIGYAPTSSGTYAVVTFQHGFLLKNSYYDTILEHLASHGFVVVAPQMYSGGPFSAPSTNEERDKAKKFYKWMDNNLASQLSVTPSLDNWGLAGHSRGGKIPWMVLEDGYTGITSIAGLDPVDGEGENGGPPYVTEGGLSPSIPSMIMGTGLGGDEITGGRSCAPEDRNHETFYNAAKSPSYHVVATKYGHSDMLDEMTPGCSLGFFNPCSDCPSGPDDDGLRTTSAGLMAAFFRATLQGTSGDKGTLSDKMAAPIEIETDNK